MWVLAQIIALMQYLCQKIVPALKGVPQKKSHRQGNPEIALPCLTQFRNKIWQLVEYTNLKREVKHAHYIFIGIEGYNRDCL